MTKKFFRPHTFIWEKNHPLTAGVFNYVHLPIARLNDFQIEILLTSDKIEANLENWLTIQYK